MAHDNFDKINETARKIADETGDKEGLQLAGRIGHMDDQGEEYLVAAMQRILLSDKYDELASRIEALVGQLEAGDDIDFVLAGCMSLSYGRLMLEAAGRLMAEADDA